MILPIYLFGNSVLREIAKPIDKNYPNIKELVANMFETLRHADGVGLAAPQIGLPIRLFVVDITSMADEEELKGKPQVLTLINPEILETSEDIVTREEGCLSLPQIHERVPRPNSIKIKYFDENFDEHTESYEGFFARIIQHEYDHIEGKVFTDNISPLRKQLIKSKLVNLTKKKVDCKYKFK